MFISAISPETKKVLEKIKSSNLAKDFYLAGGTALAIQLGHRESIDLDWFSKKFKAINYNKLHILKSFLYFETADAEPMPKMLETVSWEEIKKNLTEKVKLFLKE